MKEKIVMVLILTSTSVMGLNRNNSERDTLNTGWIFEEKLRELLEKFRELVTAGNDQMGIPILDPYDRDYLHVNVTVPQSSSVVVDVFNITAIGLKDFVVDLIDFSLLRMKLDFGFTLPSLNLTAKHYDLSGYASVVEEQPALIFGNGTAELVTYQLKINGEAKFSISSDHLVMKTFYVEFEMDKFKSDIQGLFGGGDAGIFLNQVIQTLIPGIVITQRDLIAARLEPIILKIANDALSQISISNIIGTLINV